MSKKKDKDYERLQRFSTAIEQAGVDIFISSNEVYIRYLAGNPVDYAYVIIDKNGNTYVLCSLLEFERAREITWVDGVYGYTNVRISGDNIIFAESGYEALKKFITEIFGEVKIGVDYNYENYPFIDKLYNIFHKERIIDVHKYVIKERMIKSSHELELISRAVDITINGINYAINNINENVSERDIYLDSEYYLKRKAGAEKVFDFLIVASGPNSAYPHHRPSSRKFKRGDAVILDFVSSFKGYYGDLTRTLFIGHVSAELKKIYEVVKEALETGLDRISSGVYAKDIDAIVRKVIDKYGYGKYFMHSTGHGIGIEVHEPPRLSSLDNTMLQENMVVTIEPGIYIPNLGGVRIEEDIVITKSGCMILSEKLTRDLTVL